MAELTPRIVTNDDPDAIVQCRVCGAEKETRSMVGHVGAAHKLKAEEYVEKYGLEAGRDFCYAGSASKGRQKVATVEDEALRDLTPSERKFYDDYSQEIFGQVDRDPAQLPTVMSLTLDVIQLTRIRKQMEVIAGKGKVDKEKLPSDKVIDAIVRNQKYTAERIQATMKALGIDREGKLKNKAQIKSTPFCLLSGYCDELERMTPPQAASLEAEERKLLATMTDRISRLYLSVAPDIQETEEEENGSLPSLDVDRIIQEANIEL